MIRLLLAEDQAMMRGALSALLGLETDIEVVAAVADGEAGWRELQRLKPDVLATDIEMPGLTGLELAQRIHRHQLATRVVIVTTFARPGVSAPRSGCRGRRLSVEGLPGRPPGRGSASGTSRRPRHRPRAGHGSLVRS